jgi:uncharacterized protein YigE (DUF2233 family)
MQQWQSVLPGIEFVQRRERAGGTEDWVSLARIDLSVATLRVRYDPVSPRRVREWFGATQPALVINGGFFTPENRAAGLLIADGTTYGQTYKGFGGMLSIRGDTPQLQWLARQPYKADASVAQALQSFPMLVLDGQVVDGIPDDGSRNRRSFAGIDRAGRLVLGVCQSPVWTMTDLARFLQSSELLSIDDALNLDGGASSGFWMQGVPESILLDSIEAVPAVITVVSR